MSLVFTRDTLRAAYDYLTETPPFNKWNLPDSEEVDFRLVRDKGRFGWYRYDGKAHVIALSVNNIGQTDTLLRVMAHEMIHLHEENADACARAEHSAAFKRWAKQVCAIHGFDVKAF